MTEIHDLEMVTAALGSDYALWKEYEREKNLDKGHFFELADEELSKESAAEKLVQMPMLEGDAQGDVIERVKRFNPGWKIDEYRWVEDEYGEGGIEAVLTEDISLKPFTYINRELDPPMVFKRTVSKGSIYLDEVYLQRAEPDLWYQITYTLPWGEEAVQPLDTLPNNLTPKVAKYIYYGKPTVRLAAPREAKDDE